MTDNSARKWSEYVLKIENLVSLAGILFLSLGGIVVFLWAMFGTSQQSFVELGDTIFPWVTMLALMMIAREQWVRNIRESEGEGYPAY